MWLALLLTVGVLTSTVSPVSANELAKKKPSDIPKLIADAVKIVEQSKGEEPDDYCAFETNYMYLALSLLTDAVNADLAKTTAAVDSIKSPGFDKFRKLPEFKKWRYSLDPLPKTADGLSKFLTVHNEWLSQGSVAPPNFVTFEGKGKLKLEFTSGPTKPPQIAAWKVVSGTAVEISPKRRFELKVENHFFDYGKKSFRYLALSEVGGTEELWTMGPITGDCN